MMYTDLALFRVRAYLRESGMKKFRFATTAGVPEGSVRHIESEEWNPRISTLRKLETVIPADYQPTLPEAADTGHSNRPGASE